MSLLFGPRSVRRKSAKAPKTANASQRWRVVFSQVGPGCAGLPNVDNAETQFYRNVEGWLLVR
ncbi:MAG TPA: hypothetical protein VLZ05_24690 [Mycobacterium sp.]|nr:hypothetical protein [Mycobacterium sp.]